jgi:DNA polymerase I-like protein with 3'-5' exonuclease and polymerase domains
MADQRSRVRFVGAREVEMPKPQKISSFKEFHALVPKLVKEITKDQALAMRAMANPIFAFEELGYELAEPVRQKVEDLLRFRPAERKKLKSLRAKIDKAAGGAIDPDSPASIEKGLFKELNLRRPKKVAEAGIPEPASMARARAVESAARWEDPLTTLEGKHAVVEPLLEYRSLQASRAPLATREQYEQIRSGEVRLPVTSITLHFDFAAHEGADDA